MKLRKKSFFLFQIFKKKEIKKKTLLVKLILAPFSNRCPTILISFFLAATCNSVYFDLFAIYFARLELASSGNIFMLTLQS